MKITLIVSVSAFFLVNAEQNVEKLIFPHLPVAVSNTNNLKCKEHSEIYLQNLKNSTLWAYDMWDSTAKSYTGILRGSDFQLGVFEQCISVPSPFLPKYCLVSVNAKIPEPKQHRDPFSLFHHPNEHVLEKLYPSKDPVQQRRDSIKVGWCIPASCSSGDLKDFLNSYFNESSVLSLLHENVTYSAEIPEITCSTREENKTVSAADIAFCCLFLVLLLLLTLATALDSGNDQAVDEKLKESKEKSILYTLLMGFSAKKNFCDMTKMDDSNGSVLSILYGMKTCCIFVIITEHRFGTFLSSPLINMDYLESEYKRKVGTFIFNGDLVVDSFFIMGGILVTVGLLNHLDKRKINPAFLIFTRYIRLTPALAFVVFYYATIYNHTGSGPFWKVIAGQESLDCKNNWWISLLYLNNYINAENQCLAHSWYLACDFHYFVIAVGICMLINKHKKMGLFLLLICTIISIIIPFGITLLYQRPGVLLFYRDFFTNPKAHGDFVLTYIKSHTRATAYFIGMFFGYIYYRLQGRDIKLNKLRYYSLWIFIIALLLSCTLGNFVFYNPHHEYNPMESAIYAALRRPTFDIATVGVIVACGYRQRSFIRKVFLWSPWVPLSKLVYGAYLVHMQLQLRDASVFVTPRYFSYFSVFYLALADILMSFILALVLYLLVEAPFKNLFRALLAPKRLTAQKDKPAARLELENVRNGALNSRL